MKTAMTLVMCWALLGLIGCGTDEQSANLSDSDTTQDSSISKAILTNTEDSTEEKTKDTKETDKNNKSDKTEQIEYVDVLEVDAEFQIGIIEILILEEEADSQRRTRILRWKNLFNKS